MVHIPFANFSYQLISPCLSHRCYTPLISSFSSLTNFQHLLIFPLGDSTYSSSKTVTIHFPINLPNCNIALGKIFFCTCLWVVLKIHVLVNRFFWRRNSRFLIKSFNGNVIFVIGLFVLDTLCSSCRVYQTHFA